jgi:hypothetical protein
MHDRGARPSSPSGAHAKLLVLLASAIASCGDRTGIPTGVDAAFPYADGAVPTIDAAPDASLPTVDGAVDAARPDAGFSARRPFLVGSSLRSAPPAMNGSWGPTTPSPPSGLPAHTARRLAATWLADALDEHASVAAFARFALQLLSVGAPVDLVEDAQRASLDEIRHARLCFGLARRYGATHDGPGRLPLHDVRVDGTLVAIAELAAEEGCVGETLGAALATAQLVVAEDPEVVRVLERVATDEQRHAALAWRFIRWAVLVGGDPVREAVARRIARATTAALALPLTEYDDALADWHGHGRLTCAESRGVIASVVRDVIRPAEALALADDTAGRATHTGAALPA